MSAPYAFSSGMIWPPGQRLIALTLAATTLLVFWPVASCDFVNYDDGDYFLNNWQVRAGLSWEGVGWAFRTLRAANWHPLTWLSLMLDAQLFGGGPSGPHIINLLLHVANTVLLFAWLRALTRATGRSAFVAILFALHPLHVESVAWVSERKDVLSTFFLLLALLAYARYVETRRARAENTWNPGARSTDRSDGPARLNLAREPGRAPESIIPYSIRGASTWLSYYLLALILFACSLLSKPMMVTMPFVLLLLDYWPLQRFTVAPNAGWLRDLKPLLWEKAPFFLLSVASCIVTLAAQAQGGAVRNLATLPLSARFDNALMSYARYLGKAFCPVDLSVLYPFPGHWPWIQVALAGLLVTAVTLVVVWYGGQFPFAVTGWFWFVGTLVPVIGLVQVGVQAMADRYSYIPLVGIFVILAWCGRELWMRWQLPNALGYALALAVLGACVWQTRNQLACWQNGETLFRHAVAVTRNNTQAMAFLKNDLGNSFYRQGRLDEALLNYRQAIALYPEYELAQNNLGLALAAKGQFDEAITCYRQALEIYPRYANAHVNLGDALRGKGRVEEAMGQYLEALQVEPQSLAALNNLAALLVSQSRCAEAIHYYRRAIRSAPGYPGAYKGLGKALALEHRADEAIASYQTALQLDPNSAETHYLLGKVLLGQGKATQAQLHFSEALRLKPDYTAAARELRTTDNSPGKQ